MREKCGEWASVEQYKQRETLSSLLCSASSGLHLPVAAGPPAVCSPPPRPPPSPHTCSQVMPETASHGHGNEGPEDRLAATEQGARGTLGVDQAEGSSGDYI